MGEGEKWAKRKRRSRRIRFGAYPRRLTMVARIEIGRGRRWSVRDQRTTLGGDAAGGAAAAMAIQEAHS